MTFGEKLTTMRKQANLTQKELANRLKVSRQAITKWENDAGIPDIDNVLKISTLFNVTIEELFDYKTENIILPSSGVEEEKIDREDAKLKNVINFVLKRFYEVDELYVLTRERKLNVYEWIFDFFIGTGTLDVADILKTGFVYCFLSVEKETYRLILIHKEKMVIKRLDVPFTEKIAVIDGYKYQKTKTLK